MSSDKEKQALQTIRNLRKQLHNQRCKTYCSERENIAYRTELQKVADSITPIPDSNSSYIPKLVVMEIRALLERL